MTATHTWLDTPAGTPVGTLAQWVVEQAGRAPSVHNTQPWLWRARGDEIDLWADRSRQLPVADPHGRQLALSCGAALHHAQVAARALGQVAETHLVPDARDPDHLATLRLTSGERSARAADDFRAMEKRCTDRRRFTAWPVPDERLGRLVVSVDDPRVHVVPLTDATSRLRAALLVARAAHCHDADPAYVAERSAWVDRVHDDGLTPADGLVALCTDTDDPESWLRAGMALSALWLEASITGLSVVPLSQVVELDESRRAMRDQVFGGLVEPQILVRIGWQEIGRSQLSPTSRRPVAEILLP